MRRPGRARPRARRPHRPDPLDAPAIRWGCSRPAASPTRSRRPCARAPPPASSPWARARSSGPRSSRGDTGSPGPTGPTPTSSPTPTWRRCTSPARTVRTTSTPSSPCGPGKPVLVEKAFTRSLREAEEVLATARSGGLLAAEAMWSRYLPRYDVVRRTVEAGTLGEVVLVEADHGQRLWPDGPARLSQPELAGGALLDLGVYPCRSPTTSSAAWPTSRPAGRSPTSASTRPRRSAPAAPAGSWPTCGARWPLRRRAPLAWSGRRHASSWRGASTTSEPGAARGPGRERARRVRAGGDDARLPLRDRRVRPRSRGRAGARPGRCRGTPPGGSWPPWTRFGARWGSSTPASDRTRSAVRGGTPPPSPFLSARRRGSRSA